MDLFAHRIHGDCVNQFWRWFPTLKGFTQQPISLPHGHPKTILFWSSLAGGPSHGEQNRPNSQGRLEREPNRTHLALVASLDILHARGQPSKLHVAGSAKLRDHPEPAGLGYVPPFASSPPGKNQHVSSIEIDSLQNQQGKRKETYILKQMEGCLFLEVALLFVVDLKGTKEERRSHFLRSPKKCASPFRCCLS